MAPPDLRPETSAAIEAVTAALRIVQRREGAESIRWKGPGDLVTGTDVLSQDTMQRILAHHQPEVAFIGEEGETTQEAGDGRYWLVDPLCGTANYAARLPLYAVNVALVEDGQVSLSAVGDGATGEVYAAERGRGAWRLGSRAGEPLAVSDTTGLISLDTNFPEPSGFNRAFAVRVIAAGRWKVRVLATTLSLVYLAAGRLAGAVSAFGGSPVHSAAGLLLAQEAGATVTDEHGAPWQPRNAVQVVAATPDLHRELLELAQRVRAEL